MAGKVEGKVVLVSGAGSSPDGWSNGAAAAVLYAREGAKVVAADINIAAAQATAAEIAGEGGESLAIQCDVTKEAEVAALVAETLRRFGRIDVLHNNVGTYAVEALEDTSEASWDRVFAINLKSTFLLCKHAIPAMVGGGGGAIVNISSIASIRWAGADYFSYYSSKAGLNQFSRMIGRRYAKNQIRCNTILPGLIDTPQIRSNLLKDFPPERQEEELAKRHRRCPPGRMGTPWDIARAAVFLASDDSAYINGVELPVDGGITL